MAEANSILEINAVWQRWDEQMGSKRKFWFLKENEKNQQWLFKQARPDTGEHWAEKIASEIADQMGLPTHEVVLASYDGKIGCAVRSFLRENQALVHGNELMAGAIDGYDKFKHRGQADHNFDNIVKSLERRFLVPKIRNNLSLRFVGYLMLDALVGNTDRHHENWGIVQSFTIKDNHESKQPSYTRTGLAPTFDHASSLGRELLDDSRLRMLSDPSALKRYIRKGTGGIFEHERARKGLSPIALMELIAGSYPDLVRPWKKRVASLPEDFAAPLLAGVPESCMSQASRKFVLAFLAESRKMITSIS